MSSKLGCICTVRPAWTMLGRYCMISLRYSVGNNLVILYSANSGSFICEGGSGLLWAQKMSRSVLFPELRSGNDVSTFITVTVL